MLALGALQVLGADTRPAPPNLPASTQIAAAFPIGKPGRLARYRADEQTGLPTGAVGTFLLGLGQVCVVEGRACQWIQLQATKTGGAEFRVWLLSAAYPPRTLAAARKLTARYILQEGGSEPREFRERSTGEAVLPSLGGWDHLLPRSVGDDGNPLREEAPPDQVRYLGHLFRRETIEATPAVPEPPNARVVDLVPDLLIGLPSNTRQKDETRRYDESDYELTPLTRADYREMAEAGINCVRVAVEQLPWVQDLKVFYWGVGGNQVPYPESLYRSDYLGPVLFLDEPAVGTRDHVIRPRLAKDPAFRKTITPQSVLAAFEGHFHQVMREGAPASLIRGLAARPDVDLGDMKFSQENLFTWETMVSTAAYQLSQDPLVPAAMVFEPPGRVGTRRTLPELDMTYGCQLPTDDPKILTDILYGFLRGAARLTGKDWGTSIYGAVDRSDAFWFLTRAYDLGATRFFFWDNYRLACVPFGESLALTRGLRAHAASHPRQDLQRLRHAAETVILLPPGYNLGHVHLGKGNLWGLGELNLERPNQTGVQYRVVMSNFFTEIERCIRLGVAFDLLWDLPGIQPTGYRELVRIREDGKVEVRGEGPPQVLSQARLPARPAGAPPHLSVSLSADQGGAPLAIIVRATVTETTAPVYYTLGADPAGIYHNAVVAWELYGPGEEDYRIVQPPGLRPRVERKGSTCEVVVQFRVDRPGHYRLRAATADLAGRTAIAWTPILVHE